MPYRLIFRLELSADNQIKSIKSIAKKEPLFQSAYSSMGLFKFSFLFGKWLRYAFLTDNTEKQNTTRQIIYTFINLAIEILNAINYLFALFRTQALMVLIIISIIIMS